MKRKKQTVSYSEKADEDRPKELVEREKTWAGRLSRAKSFQEKYKKGWDENKRLIFSEMSDPAEGTVPGSGAAKANRVSYGWGLYEGLETAIYVQNPDILVTARDASQRPNALRVKQVVNYDMELMDAKEIGNLCLLDTFINGYGAVIEAVETEHKVDEDGEKTGEVEWQGFGLRRIEPTDILFDPQSKKLDLSDCRYLFVAWYPTIDELRNDPRMTDLPKKLEEFPESSEATRGHSPGASMALERQAASLIQGQPQGETDPSYKTICVWECYDKVNHKILYITDNKGYIIGEGEWPTNLRFGPADLYPITLLYAHPVPGRFYPRPEAELIAPQLREINITEKMISEDSTTKFRKWITLAGIFTDDQKAKVTDTDLANAMIYVDATQLAEVLGVQKLDPNQVDMRNLVVPIEDVAPKKDLYIRYEMLEKQIQHIIGYGPSARGGLPSTRSAREAMMINAKQDQRLDKRKDRIISFYRLLAMKHIRFLQHHMATERYAKVMSKAGQLTDWMKYSREEVLGDFEFEVVAGTTTPKNTEVKKASVQQMAQLIMPILMQRGQDVRPVVELLAEYWGWDEVDRCFSDVKQHAEALARGAAAFMKGQIPPQELMNLIGRLLMAELTPQEFAMIEKQMNAGKPQMGAPGGGEGAPAPEGMGQRGDPNPQATAAGGPPQ